MDSNRFDEKSDKRGKIKIDGSSTVFPITEAVAEEFNKIYPRIRVSVGLSGTGGGFKKFSRGEIDISNASRPIKDTEIESSKKNNIDFVDLIAAYDGLSVVVNPKNTWVDYLTVAELKKIWEPEAQGKIMRWNQIRPEWPDEEIHLYGAGVESGTYDYFTEAIVGKSHSSRGDFTASEDDNVLVQGISTDKLALGFFGFAYFEENRDKLKLVPIDDETEDNGQGPILPSVETVMNKTYAPLARPLFIYVSSESVKREDVRIFVNYYLDNTKTLAREVGYIALTPKDTEEDKKRFFDFCLKYSNIKADSLENERKSN
ncbi:PstS family phosphate ABC transporter substrate-binding protein [Daejeonella oryzae]|uniref:PstS family phosphate ABC transporter substrate-binding protein n=1 Tax=Daejeonella oryzae TaxID=1122943 RepID=UPI0004082A75|nr:PstS family phosphate ABC transporter substrate-binding protein [Daejeonella oryzae]